MMRAILKEVYIFLYHYQRGLTKQKDIDTHALEATFINVLKNHAIKLELAPVSGLKSYVQTYRINFSSLVRDISVNLKKQ